MAKYVNLAETINAIRLRLDSLENSKREEIRRIEEKYQRLAEKYRTAEVGPIVVSLRDLRLRDCEKCYREYNQSAQR